MSTLSPITMYAHSKGTALGARQTETKGRPCQLNYIDRESVQHSHVLC